MRDKNTFFCTRPRLASKLMECGYDGKIVPNPYRPDAMAWEFPRDEKLNKIVDEYLARNSHRTPRQEM